MGEYVRSLKVSIDLDTNKRGDTEVMEPHEGESYSEFAQRVAERIVELADAS